MEFRACILFWTIVIIAEASKWIRNIARHEENRVFGGVQYPAGDIRKQAFTVLIRYFEDNLFTDTSDYECSGTIITEDYVLTTAFCLQGHESGVFFVGITGLKGLRHDTTISEIKISEDYDPLTQENNVALGKVLNPFPLETGEFSVPFAPEESWGPDQFWLRALVLYGHSNPQKLEVGYVTEPTFGVFYPRSRNFCTMVFKMTLRENEFCATSVDFRRLSVCARDFGAGLMYIDRQGHYYLYAMAVFTDPYTCTEGPTAFIVISDFLDWIEDNLE
ncbi:uncharacterized protein LOC132266159 [Phlebotomus argentipes]|uniref:uncharacterized protein LOC132266159 n=1 Tax=Phlebotomus argentipes TaxID=94469 RepID=UPI0028937AE4|nr:uncharacterized protein LOC132266159 [Phlebotomus argentipes]